MPVAIVDKHQSSVSRLRVLDVGRKSRVPLCAKEAEKTQRLATQLEAWSCAYRGEVPLCWGALFTTSGGFLAECVPGPQTRGYAGLYSRR